MAGKVVSFKIGDSVTHVAEVDYEAKAPKIYHAFTFETPKGVLDESGVHVTEEFINMIKQGMSESGIQNNRAIFTMNSGRVANREVTIPLVKESKIKPLLIANSKDYFPVDLSQYQLVYHIIEQDKVQKQMKLSVYAVPNSLIDSYQTLAKSLNLQLVAIDYYGNSIYQAMTHSMSPELAATICIDDNNSMITIIKDSKVLLQRSIGYGIDDAVLAMMDSTLVKPGSTYIQALTQMQMNLCFNTELRPKTGVEEGAPVTAKDRITTSLTMLISNISRVLDYFSSRNADVEIDHISLVGLGADCQGLDKLLTNELGVEVSTLLRFGSADITRSLSAQRFHLGEYYACIGTAIQPLNFVLASQEKKKEKEQSLTGAFIALGCCALASVIIVMVGLVGTLLVSKENNRLRAQIEEQRSVIDIYNEYVRESVIHDGAVTMDSMTDVANSQFLSFLSQMEDKMPSDLLVSTMSATEEGITMSVSTKTKESAAEAIMQLRTFTCAGDISCSGITEEEDDNGTKIVNFDITVNYLLPDVQASEDSTEANTQDATEEEAE